MYPPGPKGYQRSDERLCEDISERLMQAEHIDSSDVSVEVKGAKVVLEGTVPSRHMKHAIEDLVDACPGVQDIDNRIRVVSGRERPGQHPGQQAGQQIEQDGTRQSAAAPTGGAPTAGGLSSGSGLSGTHQQSGSSQTGSAGTGQSAAGQSQTGRSGPGVK
jgi:hypothetical protein